MNAAPASFLFTHGGAVLRWRTAADLLPDDPSIDRAALRADLLGCAEVRRWLDRLGSGSLGSGPLHASIDTSAENALAKLCEYGLRAGLPALDERALPYCAVDPGEPFHAQALIIVPFLVRAGYAGDPRVARWLARRIDILYEQACRADYDFFMDDAERRCLPSSQQLLHGTTKHFYKQSFDSHWGVLRLPTCYDLYALAYLPIRDPLTRQKVEAILAYLLNPAFQDIPEGYIWNASLRRPYSAGRVFLACLPREDQPEKLVLFLEMLANFENGRASAWFRRGMAHLAGFRTARGTYCFPRAYLSEKTGYYLYAGMHMGLGESPRDARALELESTFRMTRLQRLLA